jgi:fluoride exporter
MRPGEQKILEQHRVVAVFVGGAIGTLLRAGLLELSPVHAGQWPWATFIANIAGCLVLGYALTHLHINGGSSRRVALLGTGFCGGLTTFSTFQLEIYELFDGGHALLAGGYAATSLVVGMAAVSVARRAVRGSEELA